MRGGGIFGPEFGGHVKTAGEDAQKGWFHFTTGLAKGNQVRQQAQQDYTDAYKQQRSQSMGGMEPEQDTHSDLAIRAMQNLRLSQQGRLVDKVAKQHYNPRREYTRNPLLEPVKAPGQATSVGNLTPHQIQFGGKRKTKKRRRKRKKKKTKRKKRRRKRKTKKRRKKYN